MLRFIERNQKKKPVVTSTQGSSENELPSEASSSDPLKLKPKFEPRYDALSELLMREVQTLQTQQTELETKLRLFRYQNEVQDMSFQMSLNQQCRKYAQTA